MFGFKWLTSAQDPWIGVKVFAKAGAKPENDDVMIDEKLISYPATVTAIKGEWLWIGRAWIKKSEVVMLDRAIPYFTQQIRRNPTIAYGYNGLATARQELGDLDGAIKDYFDAIRLDPKDATFYNGRGKAWLAKGNLDNALADYAEAIRLDPKYASAYSNRGIAWHVKWGVDNLVASRLVNEDLDNALQDCTEAIRLDPKNAMAYVYRGNIWNSKGNLDNALQDYTEAIRLDPRIAIGYFNRGDAWKAKGKLDNALQDYTTTIRLDPNNPMAYNRIAWLRATSPDARYRDGKVAVKQATKAYELTTWQDIGNLVTLAAACAEAGDFVAAVKWQNKVMELAEDEKDRTKLRERLALYEKNEPYRERAE